MEIDNNDLGHLSYGLELDDIDHDLPHSTIVRDVAGDKGKKAMGTHKTYMVVNRGDEPLEIDEACLDHSADVEHPDDRPHTHPKPKRKQLKKKKSPGKKSGKLKGGAVGAAIQARKERISPAEDLRLPAQRSRD